MGQGWRVWDPVSACMRLLRLRFGQVERHQVSRNDFLCEDMLPRLNTQSGGFFSVLLPPTHTRCIYTMTSRALR